MTRFSPLAKFTAATEFIQVGKEPIYPWAIVEEGNQKGGKRHGKSRIFYDKGRYGFSKFVQ